MFGVRRMGGLRKLGRSTMKAPYRIRPTVGANKIHLTPPLLFHDVSAGRHMLFFLVPSGCQV
jgi:hypothetical protein